MDESELIDEKNLLKFFLYWNIHILTKFGKKNIEMSPNVFVNQSINQSFFYIII